MSYTLTIRPPAHARVLATLKAIAGPEKIAELRLALPDLAPEVLDRALLALADAPRTPSSCFHTT